MELLSGLAEPLARHLVRQRWLGSAGREPDSVQPLSATVLREGDPGLLHALVSVRLDQQETICQLVLGTSACVPEHLGEAWVGAVGELAVYDATQNGALATTLLDLIASGTRLDGLTFTAEAGTQLRTGLRGRLMTAEQSNSSLVFGHRYILKLFRKPAPGRNPDLWLHRVLYAAGCRHVARPLGAITGLVDGEQSTLAMLQEFLPAVAEGWAMAGTSVRDLLADPDAGANQAGGDFAAEADRMGRAVAQVHADLRRTLGGEDEDPALVDATFREMHARLDTVMADVSGLRPYAADVREVYQRAAAATDAVPIQYIHGDLHLGQVLRTARTWLLIDFEGEPVEPVSVRNSMRSPLRDVAGMLRSFDYAARHILIDHGPPGKQARDRAAEWVQRNTAAFCEGYAAVGPDPRDHQALLLALQLDKAVYEVGYEHANRQDWLSIPLGSISSLLAGGEDR